MNDTTRRILAFIREEVAQKNRPPTIREIGARFGIQSTNGVRYHLGVLVRAGHVARDPKVARGLKLVASKEGTA